MIKKHILCGALALSMLIPMAVSAQTLTTQKNPARAPYASQIKLERQTIKNNYKTNKTIRDSIKGKRIQIKTLIAQDKTNKTLKSKEHALKSERAVIKSDRTILKAINKNLIADKKIEKADISNKHYAALVNDLKNISSLQKSKSPILQNVNHDLSTLINTLK